MTNVKITFKLDNKRISQPALLHLLGKYKYIDIVSAAKEKAAKENAKQMSGYLTDVYHHVPTEFGTVSVRINLISKRLLKQLLA